MRKYSKKAQINRLRTLFAKCIGLRDRICQRCGNADGSLQCSHIYPKGKYRSMQFLPYNAKLLCGGCHRFWWHTHPIEAQEWVKGYLGTRKYEALRTRSQKQVPFNRQFLDETEKFLKAWLWDLQHGTNTIGRNPQYHENFDPADDGNTGMRLDIYYD